MVDLLEECISSVDPQRKDYRAFQEAFCVRCRNVQCEHALGHKDKFALRVSQQFDRMMNAPQADPRLPKYANLPDFEDRLQQAMTQEIVNKKGDWSVPEIPIVDGRPETASTQTTSAVDRAVQSLAGTRGQSVEIPAPETDDDEFTRGAQEYMEEEEPPFDVCVEDVAESAGGEVVEPPKQAPVVPRLGNTPVPKGGIMIGNGPAPERPTKADPWAPPKSPGTVVKPGSTFQFGSDESESDDG